MEELLPSAMASPTLRKKRKKNNHPEVKVVQ